MSRNDVLESESLVHRGFWNTLAVGVSVGQGVEAVHEGGGELGEVSDERRSTAH